jgi:hypothetical protein
VVFSPGNVFVRESIVKAAGCRSMKVLCHSRHGRSVSGGIGIFKHPISRVWWPRIPAARIEHAITAPIREVRQQDGRIRRWIRVPEMENRYLPVILLKDGETVHNAFFDRRFTP